jgi:hypothetical protein
MNINDWKGKTFPGNYFDAWFYADSLEECEKNGEPFSCVYFMVDQNTIIETGCDPLSPREFLDENIGSKFYVDFSIECKKMGDWTVYYAKKIPEDLEYLE